MYRKITRFSAGSVWSCAAGRFAPWGGLLQTEGMRALALVAALLIAGGLLRGLAGATPTEATALHEAAHATGYYSLPAAKLAQAAALHRVEEMLAIGGTLWTPVQLVLLLALGWVARMRDASQRLPARGWMRTAVFVLLFVTATTVLDLPLGIYAHRTSVEYGLSVQTWLSWFADRGKALVVNWVIGTLLAVVVLACIRRWPRSWWLRLWPIGTALVLAGVFVTPYVIDPLFNSFEPLSRSDPALVVRLEQVVERSGMVIPPERMFLMRASAKVTGLNAYVTGFGRSKRIVVWVTTVARSSQDEIALVFAHELGHYALDHIVLGIGLACGGLLPLFWLGSLGLRALLGRFGARWRIAGQEDMAALAVLLLVFTVVSAGVEPLGNAISRRMEHNADVYGEEAVHGIVADPQTVGVQSFQTLGETSLEDPAPHPYFDLWFGTHPPIAERAAFAAFYNPWVSGEAPKYFAR